MAILLLCRGDEEAKNLLRQSINAHYGSYPVAYESVRMIATGRVKQSIASLNVWLSLDLDTKFLFPDQFRQDYKVKLWQIPLLNKSEAFDGIQHYQQNRNKPADITTHPDPYLQLVTMRLCAFSSMLLLPLSEVHIELSWLSECSILVTNTATKTTTKLSFYDNFQLKQIVTTIEGNQSEFRMDLSKDVVETDSVKTFKAIKIYWNDEFRYELYPSDIRFTDQLAGETFVLN